MEKKVTDLNFDEVVLKSSIPVLVDFGAEWCGPCKNLKPTIAELAKVFEGKAVIATVNVDEQPEVSNKYGIRSVPTLIFFKNGEVVDKHVGVIMKSELENKINALL